ncbi:MAG: NMD3-related protein [Candidatus Nanohaloarchaea archaeon]
MELSKFCPRCGREVEKLYGEKKKYCSECYTDVHSLADIPSKVEITRCSVCGRMRHRGEWIEAYSIEDQLGEKFSEFAEGLDMELQFWEEEEEFFVRAHLQDREMQDFEDVRVEWSEEQCGDCARFEGGFYKAKIQLRGEDLERVSDDIVDKAAELTNRNRSDFLSNVDPVDGGYDFYLSTEKMNRKILSMLRDRFDPEIERSYELVSEEDGQKVYRNVVSVRI